MYRAILFDLDNTLFDRNQAMSDFLYQSYTLCFHDLTFENSDLRSIHRRLTTEFNFHLDFSLFCKEFRQWCAKRFIPDPRLAMLGSKPIRDRQLAIITNGSVQLQRTKITASGLDVYFRHIFISAETGFRKPDPLFFNLALQTLNRRPAECLMVGDCLRDDIAGAARLGIATCWISGGRTYTGTKQPDYHIDSVWNLPEILSC